MSIQSVQSSVPHPVFSARAQASQLNAGQRGAMQKPASQSPPQQGVDLMRRELETRGTALKQARQPSAKMLNHLANLTQPTHAKPARELADQQAKPTNVSLSDVKAAMTKLGITTITETGEPVTQEWIDKQLAALDSTSIKPPQQRPEPQMYEITTEGLLANWGKSDSIYDLTGNGTVDGEDLLMLLSNGGTMMVEIPADMDFELTLEGLIAAWGKSNSPYDLDGDGIVDGLDLLLFLQGNGNDDA